MLIKSTININQWNTGLHVLTSIVQKPRRKNTISIVNLPFFCCIFCTSLSSIKNTISIVNLQFFWCIFCSSLSLAERRFMSIAAPEISKYKLTKLFSIIFLVSIINYEPYLYGQSRYFIGACIKKISRTPVILSSLKLMLAYCYFWLHEVLSLK